MKAPLVSLPALLLATSLHAAPPTVGGCPVFPADNAWNTPVDRLPVHPSSTAWVNTIGSGSAFHPDFGTFYEGAPIGIPFVTVPGSQPAVPIVYTEAGDESDPGPFPIPPNAPIEGGPSSGGDRHVIVVETGTCTLYELFSAYPQNGGTSWEAYSGAKWNLNSNNLRPDTWTSADAAGLPILPGLVRRDEVLAGEINHALRFTAPQTSGATWLWPARHEASSLTGSQYPPMGARFRLKASFDISGYSPQNQVILRALKKYGMILADNGSRWYVSGEHNPAWDDDLLGELKALRGSDFEAVDGASLRISANSGRALQPPPAVTLREVANSLSSPVALASAPDGSGRLFIVEKGGIIKILKNGAVLPTPFLNLSTNVSTSGERGLLGLAFDPFFAQNGRFFVYYTMAADGAIRVSAYYVTGGNPDVANPLTETPVITIPHPGWDNHNGGGLAFGHDGYLYVTTGDGGGAGDAENNAQNVNSLLGKVLRLDVGTGGAGPYSIPPDNPLIPYGHDELWAYGLRNPWRFSFDRANGHMYIGDVGQGTMEEVDFVPFGWLGGPNFGWRQYEGTSCYNPSTGCFAPNHTPPILTYGRDAAGGGQSITGGYVYRGRKSAALRGYYVFGDFVSSRVWAMAREGAAAARFVLYQPPGNLSGVSSFGEGEDGELYVASYGNGRVFAIDGAAPSARGPAVDFNGDLRGDLVWRSQASGDFIGWQLGGSGRYTRGDVLHPNTVADANEIDPGAGWQLKIVADFDGDGRSDTLWRAADGSYRTQLMNGLTPGAGGTLLGPGTGWEAVAKGDFNGDGKTDLLWKNGAGTYGAWLMNGGSIQAAAVIFYGGTGLELTHVADFNGDGKADLLGKYPDGSVRLWLMNGTAGFAAATLLGPGTSGWLPVMTADLNGDGRDDILWKQTPSGSYGGWLMNGLSATTAGVIFYGGDGLQLTHAADFDGDGKADLIGKYPDGSVRVWVMNGFAGTAAATISPAGAGWTPVHVDDANRDGRADVVVRHTSGTYSIWLMNGASAPAVSPLTMSDDYVLAP